MNKDFNIVILPNGVRIPFDQCFSSLCISLFFSLKFKSMIVSCQVT